MKGRRMARRGTRARAAAVTAALLALARVAVQLVWGWPRAVDRLELRAVRQDRQVLDQVTLRASGSG